MDYAHGGSRMTFSFEGQFLGFERQDGKLKYIHLTVLSEEMQIKLPKALRTVGSLPLQSGETIRVTGIGKLDRQTHELKLKATQITPLEQGSQASESSSSLVTVIPPKSKPKIKVVVCQKSGCLKKGGKGLCEALDQALSDRNLSQHVTIERTGCLKRCSSAPNVVITPGNHRCTQVRLKTLPQVVDAIAQKLTTS